MSSVPWSVDVSVTLKFSSDSSIASFVIAIVMVVVAFPVVTIAVVDAPVKS